MPKVTLCMIVRDEQQLLPGCLASARGAVDEIVVVDTGSTDDTRRIAQRAGSRVVDFAWCDDFAAARNAGLRLARGDWVLVLDADERLAPDAPKKLRAALAHAAFDLGLLRMHHARRVEAIAAAVVSGDERQGEPQLVPRVMRRTPDLAYVDPIHENVTPWLRKRGSRIAHLGVDVVHLGAAQTVVLAKGKLARNIRLLEARITRDPSDVAAWGYLAHECLRAGARDKAREVAERGWQYADADVKGSTIHHLATARAYVLILDHKPREARETLQLARGIEGDNPDLLFLTGHALESEAVEATDVALRTALLVRARDAYVLCLGMRDRVFAQTFVEGARTWLGWTRLGTTELLLGHPDDARRAFESVLELRPGDKLALAGCVEADIARGDLGRALAGIEPLLDDAPDGWTLAATATQALGRRADALLFAKRAVAVMAHGFAAPHRLPMLRAVVDALGRP